MIIEALMKLSMLSMVGIYFIFSNTVMPSLIRQQHGADVMISINSVILNSAFYLLFFGSSLSSLYFIATTQGCLRLGAVVFFIGTFIVTLLRNVPLNNQLKDSQGQTEIWDHYLTHWVKWNHLRTLSSFLSGILILI